MSQQLRPRPVHYEQTIEQQQADFARARRRALHSQLHDLFLIMKPDDADNYFGPLVYRDSPEGYDEQLGCSLHNRFVGWMDGHVTPEREEMERRRRLFESLRRLARERPDISLVVVEHSRSHTPLRKLAERWHRGTDKIGQEYAEGLDLILLWLTESS